ncbi:prepilin-type N-terminal cleavage/methylation domain-containing protein [Campylobacter estrildidarum]|uniref:Prepilin-type cleavage/methylation domain-containing protein n=1 Tax=Campylobacter estrildidarum TaxID=2510189 RepID=A0A4U7BFT2_9BACT|nr:prepilin-type N-terminal cleavage/methylation domain-containing protein [Campylobacter estrildidarum]TKX28570.1 prepilin-type cleavage/methylation domain-containing protein [Campylobacter estrildidarum]
MKRNIKLKLTSKAFTLIELVLVIFILGIIISITNINIKKDRLMLGAKQILSDIYYVRNLAMIQESFRNSDFAVAKKEWYKSRWQLYFIKSAATDYEQTYTIFLDKNGDGNANLGKTDINIDREIAIDILNPKKLMNSGQSGVIDKDDKKATKRFNVFKTFDIEKVDFKGSCSGSTRIVFDKLGRLYSPLKNSKSVYDKTLAKSGKNCIIRLTSKFKHQVCIVIDPLSGYAYIPKFSNFNQQMVVYNGKTIECSKI